MIENTVCTTDLLRQLAQRALQYWDMSDASLELIKVRENAVYRAILPNGEKYVVRVHRANYHSDAAIRSEFAWMRAINDYGIQTTEIIPCTDGELIKSVSIDGIDEPRQIDVAAWIDGEPLGSIEDGFESDPTTIRRNFVYLGELAARLHNQWESWTPPDDFRRGAFDVEGLTGPDPYWGRFWENPFLSDADRVVVDRLGGQLRADLLEFGVGDDRFGLIHADLLPENVLVGADGMRLIDFDDASFGWHLFDLATTLVWHLGKDYFDLAQQLVVEGYRKHRRLPDEHIELMPTFLAARMTTYLGWMCTRPESHDVAANGSLITANAVEYFKQYLDAKSS